MARTITAHPNTATRADFHATYRTWITEPFTPPAPGATPSEHAATITMSGTAGTGDGGVRVVPGLAVPWNTPTARFGVPVHFTPETLRLPDALDAVKFLVQHDNDRPLGYAAGAESTDAGLWLHAAVPMAGRNADAAMAELDLRLREGLSVGVELDPETLDAIWDRLFDYDTPADAGPVPLAGVVREWSLVTVPQFLAARVTRPAAGASGAVPAPAASTAAGTVLTMTPGRIDMPPRRPILALNAPAAGGSSPAATYATGTTAGNPTPAVVPGPAPAPAPAPAGAGAGAMSMAELAAQLAPHLAGAGGPVHPAARWSSLGDLLIAAGDRAVGARTDAGDRVAFVLADQITGNNPGVLPPTWLTDVVGIIDRGRPVISAFGGPAGAGDSGMSVTWPYYDGDLETLVDVQAAQKTEVTTGRVDIKSATANLATYAGASDISYQLLRRSSPSYREIYGRILSLAYAARTDKQFSTDITAAAVAGPEWDGATVDSLLAALFTASEQVDDATGTPGSVALAAPDVFALIGGGIGLLPSAYGTQNVPGTAQASTLTVEVSGLVIRKARHFAAGTFLLSTPEAAKWREDGPFPVEADDVAVLGRDVGIWGMGMTTVMVPAGIVSITTPPVLPLAAASTSGKASK